jgi:thymidylate kinase
MARHLPSVDVDLVSRLLAIVERDPRDAGALRALRARALHGLRPYERMSRWRAASQYMRARVARVYPVRQLLRVATRSDLRRKSPLGGGVTIAVVGSDGAGKSTLIDALRAWLAWRVNLRIEYLGSARPSRRTRILKFAARAIRAASRRTGGPAIAHGLADRLMAARYLGDARDRVDRVRRARSLAARGAVVIFDRFPLSGVRVGARVMDGPRIPTIAGWERRASLRDMAAREAALYASIPAPDHIIWLAIDSSTALRRKPDHSPESVAAKAHALESADLARVAPVTRIDAAQPLEDVVRAAKQAIWSLL